MPELTTGPTRLWGNALTRSSIGTTGASMTDNPSTSNYWRQVLLLFFTVLLNSSYWYYLVFFVHDCAYEYDAGSAGPVGSTEGGRTPDTDVTPTFMSPGGKV